MLHDTPLRGHHERFAMEDAEAGPRRGAARPGAAVGQRLAASVEYIPYGGDEPGTQPGTEIVASFGDVEREYAAIRRSAGFLDSPHRSTLLITGDAAQRRDFLNRMLTQEFKDFASGMARPAFWLNRTGRIQADLFVIELGDRTIIDVDIHQAVATVQSLQTFLVAEDVQIEDASSRFHHIAVHGPKAGQAIEGACGVQSLQVEPGAAKSCTIESAAIVIARRDQAGVPGYELIAPYDAAGMLWERLLQTSNRSNSAGPGVRPIGWHAFNIARIEAGTPLMNIDFGTTNLPHETGVLDERVSFTKGCYLGQEIVARMHNLGRPKQQLRGLRMQGDALPVAAAPVYARAADSAGGAAGPQIGVVTSSTLSPMLSAAPVAFAMLKTASAELGSTVLVQAEDGHAEASIVELRFWPPTA